MDIQDIRELLEKWLAGKASDQEQKLVEDWYQQQLAQREFSWKTGEEELEKEQFRARIEAKLMAEIEKNPNPAEVVPLYKKRRMVQWVAAASILVLGGIGGYFYLNNKEKISQSVAVTHDVAAPTNNRATITLANGIKIYLDSAANGTIAKQGNVRVSKATDGQIAYSGKQSSETAKEIEYNTLFNPRGSKIVALTLADGTRVWLNSESSLKYPVAFTGDNRTVEITGEAYFEVKHESNSPFVVKTKSFSVEDIGTEFNVNAYDDEPVNKTTVAKGSVRISSRISNSNSSILLHQNEQSSVSADGNMKMLKDVDVEKEIAWKNNEFIFEDDDIQTVMRELSRWYDLQPVFAGAMGNHHYTGQIGRDVPLSQVLKIFENIGYLNFEINNKTLNIIPTGK